MKLSKFKEIWLVDTEFTERRGERVVPICLVAHELHSGRWLELWADELSAMTAAPFDVGPDSLVVAYASTAEMLCFRVLGWDAPENLVDLYAEYRVVTGDTRRMRKYSLLEAMAHYRLDAIGAQEKKDMIALAGRGAPFTAEERAALIAYCRSDVEALSRLFPAMAPDLGETEWVLWRGRYTISVASMQDTGVPIDTATRQALADHWPAIQCRLVDNGNREYGVYDGTTFKQELFEKYLQKEGIEWERTACGRLCTKREYFRDRASIFEQLKNLYDLKCTLDSMKLNDLAVGADGRNRARIKAFGTITGRNSMSSSGSVFGPARWVRGLIQPSPGRAVCYLDYEAQEFGVSAYLSEDPNMIEAYQSGDPYLAFAKMARMAPDDATKATHEEIRDTFKTLCLAVSYGMGVETFARAIDKSVQAAEELFSIYRRTFSVFCAWRDRALNFAIVHGYLHTMFDWRLRYRRKDNIRTFYNFLSQGGAAEMLRVACILVTEAGIIACLPVHDAILIESDESEIERVAEEATELMKRASRITLNGPELRVEKSQLIRWPDRFMDDKVKPMWDRVTGILAELEAEERAKK